MLQYRIWDKISPINNVSAERVLESKKGWGDTTYYLIYDDSNPNHILRIQRAEALRHGKYNDPSLNDEQLVQKFVDSLNPKVPTQDELLNDAKIAKILAIQEYDASNEVNIFYVNDVPMWLDKATRAGLKLRFEAEMAMGNTITTLWYNQYQIPLDLESAMKMLYALEVYASMCYDNTQQHLSAINMLDTIEKVEAYNYKVGYPDKLRF